MYKGKNVLPADMKDGQEYYAQQGSAIVGRFKKGDDLPSGATFYEIEHNWSRGRGLKVNQRSVLLHDDDLVLVESAEDSEVGSVRMFRKLGVDLSDKNIKVYALRMDMTTNEGDFLKVAKPQSENHSARNDGVRGFKF